MRGKAFPDPSRRLYGWLAGVLLLAAPWPAGAARAQALLPPAGPAPAAGEQAPAAAAAEAGIDRNVLQAGCSSCGGGGLESSGCATCGGGAGLTCYPGRFITCCGCNCDGCVGRFLCGLYECICCPDPCYEPKWLAVADSAFFVDAARPVTQMRLTWDTGHDLQDPDRAEFYWARERTTVLQLGPGGPCAPPNVPGKGPACIASEVDYQSLSLYTEVAAGGAGFFIEVPYEHIDPKMGALDSIFGTMCCAESGFTDLKMGTKAVLLDCELVQVTFQFKTYVPTGNFLKGLGTGHVSLEPSLLFNVRISPETYLQGQLAYWIPIGGDQLYEGNIFHCHFSFNQVLWRPIPNIVVIGTAELNEWSVLNGAYTVPDFAGINPNTGQVAPLSASADATMVSAGPGIRLFICDKIDVGVGSAFALTGDRWEKELIRAEFRWRF